MMTLAMTNLNFGYPWWLSYGHLAVAVVTGALAFLFCRRGWSKWLVGLLGAVTVWALSVFLLISFGVGVNSIPRMPTEKFLASGSGTVLDLGAGTGRSSIMLLSARPNARLVALDLFGASFDQHFGPGEDPKSRLMANLKAAGVDGRASLVQGDMRKLPFPDQNFEGIVSAYAVDHLNREGVKQALAEASRVLKPGGEVLLILVNGRDPWLRYAFGPLLAHGGFRGATYWESQLQESGLQVVESGTSPASFWVLAKKGGAS
jgi:SAM-dependent methyltransferase